MTRQTWEVLESDTEFERFFDAGYDRVRQPDGSEKEYSWIDLPDAVMIVARIDDELVMVKQYHPATRQTFLECPAGIVEKGENYVEAAVRELEEETGYTTNVENAEIIEEPYVMPGVMKVKLRIVYVENLEEGEVDRDENEFLEVEKIPVDEALERVRKPPVNGLTLQSLLLAEKDGFLY